jgi:hypothetical protein
MRGQGLNDLPRCELERRSSHHKGIFFEVPYGEKESTRPEISSGQKAKAAYQEGILARHGQESSTLSHYGILDAAISTAFLLTLQQRARGDILGLHSWHSFQAMK